MEEWNYKIKLLYVYFKRHITKYLQISMWCWVVVVLTTYIKEVFIGSYFSNLSEGVCFKEVCIANLNTTILFVRKYTYQLNLVE